MLRNAVTTLALFGLLLAFSAFSPMPGAGGGGNDTLTYFFVGHAYNGQPTGPRIDPRIVGLDLSQYDKRIFGGDVMSEAMKYERFVLFFDTLADLDNPNTHWVVGNHDARNESMEWYAQYTGRKTYYAVSENGATFVFINTTLNAGNCEDLDAQYAMLKNICDTITSASSHLFIFQHHDLWVNVPGLPNPWDYSNWQIPYWDSNCSGDSSTFIVAIYPMLKAVHDRGVEVVSVMGDAGSLGRKGDIMQSTDGLTFIASGIGNSKYAHDSVLLSQQLPDKILLIHHAPATRSAWWEFHDLDSLYDAQ